MNKRLLVVDDEPTIGELLAAIFETRGFDVSVAFDGPTGLAMLEKEPANIMLLDYMMPGMDGIEVLCEARLRWPDLPVIIITAYGSPDLRAKAKKLNVVDVVSKPFDDSRLIDLVEGAVCLEPQ
jgi:hypothetical protein